MLGASITKTQERFDIMPNMICLCGMPGAGKSTWARNFLKHHSDYLCFNPDAYYERINGDDTIRANTFEVWMAMFRDINTAMKAGKNVLVDSDNLTFHQRMQWIEWFPDFTHILVFFDTDFDTCMYRVSHRRRKLTRAQMIDRWGKWQRPIAALDGRFWKHIYHGNHKEATDES